MAFAAFEGDFLAVSFSSFFRDGDVFPAREIISGDGFFGVLNIFKRACCDDFATMDTRSWADVDNEVSISHGFFIMFNDDEGVSKISHLFHCLDELGIVSLMKANRRLIKDI